VLPIWLASSAPESLALAAARGYGLMGPSAVPVEKMRALLDNFRALTLATSPPFVLARYLLCHRDARRAREEALPFIRDFGKNMRAGAVRIPAVAEIDQSFNESGAAESEQRVLANAIVGDPAVCIEQCLALQESLGDFVLLLKPASHDPEINRRSLTLFAERVRPALRADSPVAPTSSGVA
jgi:alkanesulfonate monooxygenase SsuD/methylene tetrahydromethanopterin reductase-like flavin-dependent oxidoreductase (luciferase family)